MHLFLLKPGPFIRQMEVVSSSSMLVEGGYPSLPKCQHCNSFPEEGDREEEEIRGEGTRSTTLN